MDEADFPSLSDAEASIRATIAKNYGELFSNSRRADHVDVFATALEWVDHRTIPPRDFLYGRHLMRKFCSATVAPGGVGKSSLVMAETLAMVTGRNLVGYKPRNPLRVWSWNGEDPFDELQRRFFATAAHYRIGKEDVAGRMFLDSGRNSPIVLATEDASGAKIATPVIDDLESEISMHGIDLVVIDPFISAHQVSENDNGKIEMVLKALKGIADRCNCAFELVHHVRKAREGTETSPEDARGASALVDACRSVRALTRMSKDNALNFGVDDVQRRSMFSVGSGKMNLGPASEDRWYQTTGFHLDNAMDDRPEDIIGVVSEWSPPGIWDGTAPDLLMRVQDRIAKQLWRADAKAAQWAGIPVAEEAALNLDSPTDKRRVGDMLKLWIKSGALVEVEALDEKRNARKFVGVGKSVHLMDD